MREKKYILYSHGGSANHGCEALVRSTIQLLNISTEKVTLISNHPEEDKKYGIDKICTLSKAHDKKPINRISFEFLKGYYDLKIKKNYETLDNVMERKAVNAKKGDIALSIGGDNYCYDGKNGCQKYAKLNRTWREGNIKTVLWGCSIEPELLEYPEVAEDISKFNLITARESISYNALVTVNPNTVLVCDTAFLLQPQESEISSRVSDNNYVGINLSPMAEGCEAIPGITKKNYEYLIDYILRETTMNIALIPHVVREHNDDRKINDYFYEKYKHTNRIISVPDCTCCELKAIIGKCRFFIGARTHATIAAYSSFVPTLALGYSVKARGIARDIFDSEDNYVLPVQELKHDSELTEAFIWLYEHEVQIRNRLNTFIPKYIYSIYKSVDLVKKM